MGGADLGGRAAAVRILTYRTAAEAIEMVLARALTAYEGETGAGS